MARLVVINVTCDKCLRTVVESDSVPVEYLAPEASWEMDLCVTCFRRFTTSYLDLARTTNKRTRKLAAGDNGVEQAEKAPGTYPCPISGCDYLGVSANAVGIHKRHTHGIMGKAHDVAAPTQREWPCDVDDCDYIGTTKQALGTHQSRTHGIAGVSRAAGYRVKPVLAAAVSPSVPCLAEGCDYVGISEKARSKHLGRAHGWTAADIREAS
jgi:hypothetical protein